MSNQAWRSNFGQRIGMTLLATALTVGANGAFGPPAVAKPPPGYRLVWSDEFHRGRDRCVASRCLAAWRVRRHGAQLTDNTGRQRA
jgi:hypothetical protein